MRRAARVDGNQAEIVQMLHDLGCSVETTHSHGSGFPDLVAGAPGLTLTGRFNMELVKGLLADVDDLMIHDGANLLIEVKNPDTGGTLSKRQREWHRNWIGQKIIVRTVLDIVRILYPK